MEPAEKSYGKGAWKPPSQNKEQQRGNIFSIQQPQDLLDFVVEDERLSVGEFESNFDIYRIYNLNDNTDTRHDVSFN